MVTETDRNKARSAVVSAYHALDCVTIPFSFLHAFADAAVDAVSTDAEPFGWTSKHFNEGEEHRKWGRRRENVASYEGYIVQALYADPVKTAPAVAVKPLRWKGPDSSGEYHSLDGLWGYIIRDGNGNGFWLTEIGDYFPSPEAAQEAAQADYEARIRSALSAQVQDVAGWQNEEKLTPEQAWTILCETPDITSPEEYPDHALITFEQLQSYMERAHNSVEWKDISTAPRDGTKILMRGGAYHGLPFAGYWDRSPYSPDRPWVSAVNNSRLYEHVPTQWMPLPSSPASKHGDAE